MKNTLIIVLNYSEQYGADVANDVVVHVSCVSCLANCNSRVTTANDLVVAVLCSDYCSSPIEPLLQVRWTLFEGGPSPADQFTEVSNIDSIATGKMRLVLVA